MIMLTPYLKGFLDDVNFVRNYESYYPRSKVCRMIFIDNRTLVLI